MQSSAQPHRCFNFYKTNPPYSTSLLKFITDGNISRASVVALAGAHNVEYWQVRNDDVTTFEQHDRPPQNIRLYPPLTWA